MECSKEFETWFQKRFVDKLNPYSSIPEVMIMGFKELAWDAWQAGKQVGYDESAQDAAMNCIDI